MEIENKPIDEIIPYEFNNRIHDQTQIDRIANSINEFGFNQPIVIDENNVILVGHGRLLAARKLGKTEVPTLKKLGLKETQKKAYRILDNKLQNDSTWSFDNLDLELGFLEDNGFDLEPWGLEELRDLFPVEEPEVYEDEGGGALPDETFIKRGDLIELGKHRVLCGDSTIPEDLKELFEGNLAHLFITDPPYGVDYAGKNAFLNAIAPANRIQESIEGDAQTPTEMKDFWQLAFERAFEFTSPKASYYIFGPQGGDLMMMMMSIKDAKWQLKHMLVWVKNNHVLGRSDYNYKHEPIWFGWKEKETHNFYGDASEVSTWECNKPMKSDLHPTMKPIELLSRAIRNSSQKNEIILDSFLGSGSTLMACDQLDRICYGMEIEPRYCQVILERYKKHCEKVGKPLECKINGEPFKPLN